jgi:hypothetical protein
MAVLRLMISSNLTGAWAGNRSVFAPLRIAVRTPRSKFFDPPAPRRRNRRRDRLPNQHGTRQGPSGVQRLGRRVGLCIPDLHGATRRTGVIGKRHPEAIPERRAVPRGRRALFETDADQQACLLMVEPRVCARHRVEQIMRDLRPFTAHCISGRTERGR